MKKLFAIITGVFAFIVNGFTTLWRMFDYSCRTIAHLPGWLGGILMICLVIAVIKLVINR